MPAGGESTLAGQYTVTYNGSSLGIFNGDADVPTVEQVNNAVPVRNTDRYGDTTIDAVARGADYFWSGVCQEWKAATIAALYPFATWGLLGIIGRRYWDLSAALVMTVVAGTPAVGAPNTLTASKAILAPGWSSKIKFGPTVRVVPLRMALFPYDTGGGVIGAFTTT